MKLKWTSSNKHLIKFLISLFIMGILIGIYFYIKQPSLIKVSIINELNLLESTLISTRQNNFLYHLILLSVFTLISIIILGVPIILFYFFYEAVSIGFLIASFVHYKKISGLFYSVIFLLVNKILFYIFLIYILIISITYCKKMIISFKQKDYKIYEYIFNHLVKMIFTLIIVMFMDLFIYIFANKILAYFIFLL